MERDRWWKDFDLPGGRRHNWWVAGRARHFDSPPVRSEVVLHGQLRARDQPVVVPHVVAAENLSGQLPGGGLARPSPPAAS